MWTNEEIERRIDAVADRVLAKLAASPETVASGRLDEVSPFRLDGFGSLHGDPLADFDGAAVAPLFLDPLDQAMFGALSDASTDAHLLAGKWSSAPRP